MKETGVIRKLDGLGRIVIPKEIRQVYNIREGDALEVYTNKEGILLKKPDMSCVICGSSADLKEFKGKRICDQCYIDIASQVVGNEILQNL